MRRLAAVLAGLGALVLAALWLASAPAPLYAAGAIAPADGDAARGAVVFNAGGCASCHQSPGQEDRLRLGGGVELKSPVGSFYTPNISSDPDDGIGRWTTADLVNAMRAGVSPSGAQYYPAFPYTTYAHAREGDIADLMAFLRTVPAVKGRAPAHRLAFPFSIRRGVGLWKRVYLNGAPITDDPAEDASWNRGRYLVEALSHCAECHSARDVFAGVAPATRFAGAPDLEGRGWVPNITQAKDGIGAWSRGDIAELLAVGDTPDGDFVGGSMAAVVRNTAALPESDRTAIAAYVKSLPAREGPPKPPRAPQP